MDCPVCKNAMIVLELEQVEIDYCSDCAGIWLDAGELEQLLGDATQAKQLLTSFTVDDNCTEKPRKCPICLKKMQKVLASHTNEKILIDKCPKADGLWFDKGELKQILNLADFDSEHKVAKLLTDMFTAQ